MDTILIGLSYALVAVGLALIWGVADIVNFAHGPFMVIAMVTTAFASNSYGVDPMIMIPINAILLFAIGYVTYRAVIRPVMNESMESQIYVTFGLFVFLSYSLLVLVGPSLIEVDHFVFDGTTQIGGTFVSHPRLVTSIVCLASLGLLFGFLGRTRTGKAIRATAQDREVAKVMGIDTDHILSITWGLGTAAVGIAGTMVITFAPAHAETTPITWTLLAFAAVALGGFGNILAAGLGGIAVAFVEQFGIRLLDPSYNQIYVFSAFFIALIARQVYADTQS
ncbi:branched-chain amino acid ABC transporter permease [Halovivax cerinus]|uniref:branched-chain amino acid ABC transporter permease n=1 Tax=Halovivax cerinus TaxID=1487865 RepID=UPI0036D2B8B2